MNTNSLISGVKISSNLDAISKAVIPSNYSLYRVINYYYKYLSIMFCVKYKVSYLNLNFAFTFTSQSINMLLIISLISFYFAI